MKVLILSDVHANIIALDAVWRKESRVDMIVCVGDIVDYGPHPRESIDWMIEKDVIAISGNHDLEVIDAYEHPDERNPLTWRMDNALKLDSHHIEYLKNLPDRRVLEIDGDVYGITHAYRKYDTISTSEEFHRYSEERFSQDMKKIIFGHTHKQGIHYVSDDRCWLNPGSVSYRRPDEDYRGAHYLVIEDARPSLRSVAYNEARLYQEVLASAVSENQKKPTYHWWAPLQNKCSEQR